MPELPDIEVFSKNLDGLFAGKKIKKLKVVNGKKLEERPSVYSRAIVGKVINKIYRSGKEMRIELSNGTLIGMHLMLTGDVIVFTGKNSHHSTIVEFHFNNGQGMALTDRMKNANIRIDPKDKKGVDAISKDLHYNYLKNALKRKRMIKSLLTDQDIIRGIGNSYSDEILWETRISPYSIAEAIPDEKIRELARTIKRILKKEIKNIDRNYPGKVNGEVKTFLKIHTKEKTHSPGGAPIIIDKKGMMKTYYTKEQVLYK